MRYAAAPRYPSWMSDVEARAHQGQRRLIVECNLSVVRALHPAELGWVCPLRRVFAIELLPHADGKIITLTNHCAGLRRGHAVNANRAFGMSYRNDQSSYRNDQSSRRPSAVSSSSASGINHIGSLAIHASCEPLLSARGVMFRGRLSGGDWIVHRSSRPWPRLTTSIESEVEGYTRPQVVQACSTCAFSWA